MPTRTMDRLTPLVLGANKLPSILSAERDLERLGDCVCGSPRLQTVCLEWGLGIEKCARCGLVRTNPRLTQPAIQRCYEESAESEGQVKVFSNMLEASRTEPRSYPWRSVLFRYRRLARQLRRLFPNGTKPSALEIGFGAGQFLEELDRVGFAVQGFDIAKSGVEQARSRGFDATYAPSLSEARFPDSSLDLIVMWEVFEHIPDPDRFATEVYRILKPGGLWFLQVPNWRWLELKMRVMARVPGKKSYLSKYGVIGPLFHLFHYTHETLRKTLEPAGFKHRKSFRIRLYDENRWQALLAHEFFFFADSLPAFLSRNRLHWNVVLGELYERPAIPQGRGREDSSHSRRRTNIRSV